ncbi:MAG: sulfite exporter TauE/SafE family protein [Clostridia bacterium]|nr:sulfite exporter TauE/SafE family protein [Clostridia bacterium]
MANNIFFLIVVFLTNIIQCITGFAGTVLAMPVSVMLIGLAPAKAILNALGAAASAGVLTGSYKSVNKKEFLKMTGFLIPGIAAGYFLSPMAVSFQKAAYITLGSVVIFFAVLNFIKLVRNEESKEPGNVLSAVILLASGLIHGVFVCGGPLLVTYAGQKLKDTQEFRATLSAVWIVLNGIMVFSDAFNGYFDKPTLKLLGLSLAALAAAIVIGNSVAKKMSKKAFLILSYILMLISGISLLIK